MSKQVCLVLQTKKICIFYMEFVMVNLRQLKKSTICINHIIKHLTVLYLSHFTKGVGILVHFIRCAKEAMITSLLSLRCMCLTEWRKIQVWVQVYLQKKVEFHKVKWWIFCIKTHIIHTISHRYKDYFLQTLNHE